MRRTNVTTSSRRETLRRFVRTWAPILGIAGAPLIVGGALFPSSTVRAQVPGAETFEIEPKTPIELWHAIDYLIRTDQAKAAVPYLEKFSRTPPDDATLVRIRDRFGIESFLKLVDYPETQKFAEPLANQLSEATRRYLTNPDRIARSISALTRSPAEQDYAIARLREAGAYAVPPLIEAIRKPGVSEADRSLLIRGMGRLDEKAVPPLIAALDSAEPTIAANAAHAIGSIGDRRALPFLVRTATARNPAPAPSVTAAARSAIERLMGKPLEALPQSPVQLLTDAAWSYHRHRMEFPGDAVAVWDWDPAKKVPAMRVVSKAQAEDDFAQRLGQSAVDLDPNDFRAKVALISAKLEEASDRVGFDALEAKEPKVFEAAVASGTKVLTAVMRDSITDRKPELTASAVLALGKSARDLSFSGPVGTYHPLVEALATPSRRAQLAAARSIIAIAPKDPFPGSSRLVPVLARFVDNQPQPRGIVIDGNANRASQLAAMLKELEYDADTELTGGDGFRAATETADVEVILISYDLFLGSWNLNDTLSNLRTDPRTRLIPILIYGPFHLIHTRPELTRLYTDIKFVVQPDRASELERQMGGRPSLLTPEQRGRYAIEAAELLAKLAAQPKSPFAPDLVEAVPSLTQALSQPPVAIPAAKTLGAIPSAEAQRALADVVVDSGYSLDLRKACATGLARSLKRFGALLAADQEVKLVAASRLEADAELKSGMVGVLDAIRARQIDNSPSAASL